MASRFTAVKILTIIVPLFVIGLMVLAGFAWHRISTLSLPISGILGLLTTLLPFASLVSVQLLRSRSITRRLGDSPYIATFLLLLLDAVIITLSASHLSPEERGCSLDRTWQNLFSIKSPALKTIQDTLDCCGYKAHADKFYPFPKGPHEKGKPITCLTTYPSREGRTCAPLWEREEKASVGILLGVALAAALLKVVALLLARYAAGSAVERGLNQPWFARNGAERRRITGVEDDEIQQERYLDAEDVGERRNGGYANGARRVDNGGETQRLLSGGDLDGGQTNAGPAFGAVQPSLIGGASGNGNEGGW